MNKQVWRGIAFSVVLAGSAQAASAAEIQYRGFASIVGGSTLSSDEALYGYEDTLNFRNDSLMALQMDATLDSELSATMQIMSRGAESYDPVVEWAYLTYKFNDQLQLSAGRIRIPFYRYSDFMDVRYTYNWLMVPQTVYGFNFPGYDGLSGVYSSQFGSWDSSLQLIFGQFEGETSGFDATLEDLKGFSWTLTRDWLTLRSGYVSSKGTIEIDDIEQLASGVEALGAGVGQDLDEFIGREGGDVAQGAVLEGQHVALVLSGGIIDESNDEHGNQEIQHGATHIERQIRARHSLPP